MKLTRPNAQLFVPDGLEEAQALRRTTHMAIAAHQDDIEIMAIDGILKCFGRADKWFTGVVVTDGAGSPRAGLYKDYTDEQMRLIRVVEQKKAAMVGEYAAQALLDFPSAMVKNAAEKDPVEDIMSAAEAAQPEVVYTHNLADKHPTHVAVALRVIEAIRGLPEAERPKKLYGCEVWRDLGWMNDEDKVVFDTTAHENLQLALLGVFDSQISGGKRYDLATMGRRRANATYFASHAVDVMEGMATGMDLTPLIEDPSSGYPGIRAGLYPALCRGREEDGLSGGVAGRKQMNRRQRLMGRSGGRGSTARRSRSTRSTGWTSEPDDDDPFNIYNHPSWRPLIELAREKSDRIVMRTVPFTGRRRPAGGDQQQARAGRTSRDGGLCGAAVRAGKRQADQPDAARPGGEHDLDGRAPAEGRRRPEGLSGAAAAGRGRRAGHQRGAGGGSGAGRERDRDDRHERPAVRGGAAVPDGGLHGDRAEGAGAVPAAAGALRDHAAEPGRRRWRRALPGSAVADLRAGVRLAALSAAQVVPGVRGAVRQADGGEHPALGRVRPDPLARAAEADPGRDRCDGLRRAGPDRAAAAGGYGAAARCAQRLREADDAVRQPGGERHREPADEGVPGEGEAGAGGGDERARGGASC